MNEYSGRGSLAARAASVASLSAITTEYDTYSKLNDAVLSSGWMNGEEVEMFIHTRELERRW